MKPLRALGLMSGTSLDGIDLAVLETDGDSVVSAGQRLFVAYDAPFRQRLRQAIHDARGLTQRTDRPGTLASVEQELTQRHAMAVAELLRQAGLTPAAIDVIGFHGQTVLHRPRPASGETRLTVQLGDGPALARSTGIPVIYDMRAADFAAAGQGAPLVPVYHRALASRLPQRPLALLNIGGVANVTLIDRSGDLIACDTGPGGALIDDLMQRTTGAAFDADGALARSGRVDETSLARLLADPFFLAPPPKSLDRNAFDPAIIAHLSAADAAATLTHFTARGVERVLGVLPVLPHRWVVAGGGRHNSFLMECLQRILGVPVDTAEAAGFDGDATEAEAWAYLAVRSLKGLPLSFPLTTGVPSPMTGGRRADP